MATSNPIDRMTPLVGPPNKVQTSGQISEAKTAKSIIKNDFNGVVNQYASSHQSNSSGGSQDPPVYMGITYTVQPKYGGMGHSGGGEVTGSTKVGSINTPSLSSVAGQYYTWDGKTKAKFLTQLSLAGYNTSGMTDDQLSKAWAAYAQQSANYLARGVKQTPWDIMARDMHQRESASSLAPQVSTTSNVQLSTASDAHALFSQAAQSLLGRAPTKAESRNFLATINSYEREHPTTTTTTTTPKSGGGSSSSSVTTGGASAAGEQDVATQEAKKDPEYGAYQAATTYYNALMDMVGKS